MEIHGFNKTTLLDYPGHVACTVFTGHCNMRCPFCHNGDLVLTPGSQPAISEEEFFSFLNKRKNILEGVAITGGEPTIQADLPEFIKRIKDFNLEVKLDSNGMRPEILRKLMDENLVDYFAMDIKSSKSRYAYATGIANFDLGPVEESVSLLMENRVPYEFRTTVLKPFHNTEVFEEIAEWIKDCSQYYLQNYVDSHRILKDLLPEEEKLKYPESFEAFKPDELIAVRDMLKTKGMNVFLRGVDE
ncbi:MAG: anaerobic ribonucleoside-triphosphate reductase activating protein [Lachnospiraceae bacterium]|nr:anaerobic ribonucleoside-triphosphate reductase activating protein [Lachnospiraceae bacterium]